MIGIVTSGAFGHRTAKGFGAGLSEGTRGRRAEHSGFWGERDGAPLCLEASRPMIPENTADARRLDEGKPTSAHCTRQVRRPPVSGSRFHRCATAPAHRGPAGREGQCRDRCPRGNRLVRFSISMPPRRIEPVELRAQRLGFRLDFSATKETVIPLYSRKREIRTQAERPRRKRPIRPKRAICGCVSRVSASSAASSGRSSVTMPQPIRFVNPLSLGRDCALACRAVRRVFDVTQPAAG